MTPEKILEDQIIMVIKTIEDPEIPVNIYELGLIYFINIKPSDLDSKFDVEVEMTLTSCYNLGPYLGPKFYE